MGHVDVSAKFPESGPLLEADSGVSGWVALGPQSASLSVRDNWGEMPLLPDSCLGKPILAAALFLVLPWVVPEVEGQAVRQKLKPQEAGAADLALLWGGSPGGRGSQEAGRVLWASRGARASWRVQGEHMLCDGSELPNEHFALGVP